MPFLLLRYLFQEVLGSGEQAHGLLAAGEALGRLAVFGDGAILAKVMSAPGHHGAFKILATNKTGEGKAIILFLIGGNLELLGVLLSIGFVFPLALQLPSTLVVTAVMQEFATVTKTAKACLLIVLANIRSVVEAGRAPDTGRRTLGPNSELGPELRVLLDIK